jgi:hypothetical protein
MVRVTTPERLPASTVPMLTQRIGFDVCVPPRSPPLTPREIEKERRSLGDRISAALSRAGVSADLTPAPGSPARFTVTQLPTEFEHGWSMAVSLLTLSVIPGYFVDRTRFEVNLAWRDSAQLERRDHLQYESRMSNFVWAPLAVYPDFFMGLNGGWESSKSKDGGLEGTMARLADDLRVRLVREAAPGSDEVGVVCPNASARSGG